MSEPAFEVEIEDLNKAPPDDFRYMGEKVAPVRVHHDRTSHPGYRLELSEFSFASGHFTPVWAAMLDAKRFVHQNGGTANLSISESNGRGNASFVAAFKEERPA